MPQKKDIKIKNINKQNQKAIKKVAGVRGFGLGQTLTFVLLLIIILPTIFITLNEYIFKIESVPHWKEIFAYFQLDNKNPVVDGLSQNEISVHFIDVGQGDCELIQTPEFNILIDTGEMEFGNRVVNYLKSQNVEKIDYFINTHPHSDHIGGAGIILSQMKTDKIIMPKLQDSVIPTTSVYSRMIDVISSKNIGIVYAEPNMKIELGEDTWIDILAPVADYDDLNNYSVVFKLTHGENTFLFTGDIESKAEEDIQEMGFDISAKVLKVPHHGSSTSSKKKFLRAVGGQYAVIEVGAPNTHNHPNDKVVERLVNNNYTVLRTDINGNVVFISDKTGFRIFVDKE